LPIPLISKRSTIVDVKRKLVKKQVDHTLPIAAGQVDLNKADYEVVH
jgi:hypothetical protein